MLIKLNRMKTFSEGISEEERRYMAQVNRLVEKTSRIRRLYLAVNALMLIFGLLLIAWKEIAMPVFGVLLLYVGIIEFLTAYQARKIKRVAESEKMTHEE